MVSSSSAEEIIELVRRHGGFRPAAKAVGQNESSIRRRYGRAIASGHAAGAANPDVSVEELKAQVLELRAALRAHREDTLTDEYVKRKIIGIATSSIEVPRWTTRPLSDHAMPGTPSAFWSDWHWGEVVEASQIGGVNEYDLTIARERVRTLVEKTIHLLRRHVVNPKYPGIIINIGGDMVSGDIHDELSQTNEMPLMPAMLDLYGVLIWAIRQMADEFGQVFVPCVTGNHGRNTKKPRAKGRNYTNFDWLLYQFLSKALADDDRVSFLIPDGPDALYRVYGHRYLLTHGDQFRGGDGQIGAIGPITRGNKRKLARNTAINREYDTMLLGHWHQYMPLHRQIVNGSLKGYDEYANANNFEYEPPTQALWLTHPEHGVTIQMPVYLGGHAKLEHSSEWVSWKRS